MKTFQITLFGRFSLTSESRFIPVGEGTARLLAYLSLSYDRSVSRSRTAGALWPDLSERRARANLSTALWRLRQVLVKHRCPLDIIQASTDLLNVASDLCEVDVTIFVRSTLTPGSRAVSLGTLARAVHALELYKGDLLEDWDVEWCRLEREELRKHYVHTLQGLCEGFEQRGRIDLALRYVRKAAQAEPLNETVQRTLMRLLYRVGDKASAVTEFNRFAGLAKSELGVEPDKETLALLRQIRRPSYLDESSDIRKAPVPIPIRPDRVPLIGRDIERLELNALLDSTVAGEGGGVLLLGEAGIGKSKLADWVMEEWAARGGAAGRGRCIEFNDPVPYQPLLDALGSFVDGGDLSGFVSGDGSPGAHLLDDTIGGSVGQTDSELLWPPGKLRLFARLGACLENASQRRPMLAVIDLQWADVGTIDFLTYLLARARSMRLAVLLTSRPSGASTRHRFFLERLSRYCGATLRLSPLSEAETNRLVKSLLEGNEVSPALARWAHVETEGNPLFIIETLRLQQRQDTLETSAPRESRLFALPDKSVPMPEGVRSTVEQRLALVDPQSHRIAQIASVIGRSFEEDVLGMVVGARRNLSQAIGQLLQEGIFEREGFGYRFSHDKIRAVCYESLPTRARRTFHARAAAALLQVPDFSIHRLAWHQHSAGQWNLATSSWERAGDHAREICAYEEALRVYYHAIVCAQRDVGLDSQAMSLAEMRLLVKSDEVLAVLGRPEDRKSITGRMGVLAQQIRQPWILATWWIRRALLEEHVGNFSRAVVLARRAWRTFRSAGDRPGEVEALRVLAWALTRVGRYHRSLAVSQLALRRLGGTKSASTIAILWQASNAYIQQSDYISAAAYLDRARSISLDLGNVGLVHILTSRGIVDRLTGNGNASRNGLLAAMKIATETSEPIAAARVGVQIATLDVLEGKLGMPSDDCETRRSPVALQVTFARKFHALTRSRTVLAACSATMGGRGTHQVTRLAFAEGLTTRFSLQSIGIHRPEYSLMRDALRNRSVP